MTEFKARVVKLRRVGNKYVLMFPRGSEASLIPPMCQDWEVFTGLKLEPGEEVNLKLHVELKSKIRQTNKPIPPHSEPEPTELPVNYGMDYRPQPNPPRTHVMRQDPLAERYAQVMTRLSRHEAEELQQRLMREMARCVQEITHHRIREQPRYQDERYHALRHRDPGAPWDVTIR